MGEGFILSALGKTTVSPYTEDDDAYTNFWILESAAALRRFIVPLTFTALVSWDSRRICERLRPRLDASRPHNRA